MATRKEWAIAFADQARSDFDLYHLLRKSKAEECHPLHYLQMACEKIAKAYRFRDTKTDQDALVTSHSGFSKFITALMMRLYSELEYQQRIDIIQLNYVKAIAREIEALCPTIDNKRRPENAEYPWEGSSGIIVPRRHSFPYLESLRDPSNYRALQFWKLLRQAFHDFETLRIY